MQPLGNTGFKFANAMPTCHMHTRAAIAAIARRKNRRSIVNYSIGLNLRAIPRASSKDIITAAN